VWVCHNAARLLGESRSLVSSVAGTTRDSVDAILRRPGKVAKSKSASKVKRKTGSTAASYSFSSNYDRESSSSSSISSSEGERGPYAAVGLDQEGGAPAARAEGAEGAAERVYRFVDTAGIRRKSKVEYGAEFFMVNRCV
jgi:predicted GTPase